MEEVDIWAIYDNSDFKRERIAFGGRKIALLIKDKYRFEKIKGYVK